MWFRAIGPVPTEPPYYLVRVGGGRQAFPENGSAYLIAGLGCSLAASAWSGQRFGLVSVDLAEFSTLYQTPLAVPFVGYRPDGSTVTTKFTTDGIIDGTGLLADFQTFYFDSRFADLVGIEIPTYGWSLDNIVFSQAPEPATAVLLVVGGLALWTSRAGFRPPASRYRRRCASAGSGPSRPEGAEGESLRVTPGEPVGLRSPTLKGSHNPHADREPCGPFRAESPWLRRVPWVPPTAIHVASLWDANQRTAASQPANRRTAAGLLAAGPPTAGPPIWRGT